MEVTVKTQCGRCGKEESKAMGLEDAQALETKEANQQDLITRLGPQLNELLTAEHPDLIVAMQLKDGSYEVQTLDNLCSAPEAKRNKGCLGRVSTLLDDMFMRNQPAPKKTKPKDAPATEAAAPKKDSKNGGKNGGKNAK